MYVLPQQNKIEKKEEIKRGYRGGESFPDLLRVSWLLRVWKLNWQRQINREKHTVYSISALYGMRGFIRKRRPISRKKVCWGRSEWHSCFCIFLKVFQIKICNMPRCHIWGQACPGPHQGQVKERGRKKGRKKENTGRKEGKKKVGKHLLSNPAPKLGVIKIY